MVACGSYESVKEGEDTIIRIDCTECSFFPSLEDNPAVMEMVVRILAKEGIATRIVLVQKRDYEYDYEPTMMLLEIARLFRQIDRQRASCEATESLENRRITGQRYSLFMNITSRLLVRDPVGAYVELKRISRDEQRLIEQGVSSEDLASLKKYYGLLNDAIGVLEKARLIKKVQPMLAGFRLGDRTVYRAVFVPRIRPDFMFAKLMASFPIGADELDRYELRDKATGEKTGVDVRIFKVLDSVQYVYHVIPPEFKLTSERYDILDEAKRRFAAHQPTRSEFLDPARLRETFTNLGSDLLLEIAQQKGVALGKRELEDLTRILLRYTIGFGLIEVILNDENVQDLTINSPVGKTPMFVVHNKYDECVTNMYPTISEVNSWASKLRMISGRPLDEANPILDTELIVPGARARLAAIYEPLNPTGLAFSIRRHRDDPWTLARFVSVGMLSPLAAGLLSFLIDGNRTMLVAGTRSSGKTSLLGAVMVEVMRKRRVITIEDTLELPVDALRKLNYNIQSLKVASALTRGTQEVSADEGIRTTLRLGDSALIVGEVRSTEAKALYEAMRVGALANIVAGTIHGDSPYGVFDRVVNDLGVPRTSFKATDIIVVANRVRSADGMRSVRKVTQITEVRKFWNDDPLREGGFVDLMKYDSKTECAEATTDLLSGDSDVLKGIAGMIREYAGNWDAVWDNIKLRAIMKAELVSAAKEFGLNSVLEAPFVIASNDEFHKISEEIKEEIGGIDSERVLRQWRAWLKGAVKNEQEKVR